MQLILKQVSLKIQQTNVIILLMDGNGKMWVCGMCEWGSGGVCVVCDRQESAEVLLVVD